MLNTITVLIFIFSAFISTTCYATPLERINNQSVIENEIQNEMSRLNYEKKLSESKKRPFQSIKNRENIIFIAANEGGQGKKNQKEQERKQQKERYKKEFKSLPIGVKKKIVKIINAYEIALNSPKFLFSQKVSEAKAQLNDFMLEYSDPKKVPLASQLILLSFVFDSSAIVEDDIGASEALRDMKEITGQL